MAGAHQMETTMHMLTLLPAELVSVRTIRNHLDQLARGVVEPAYPGMGICFNMSGHLGVQLGVHYGWDYPQAYMDFGTGLFKLLNAPEMELHGLGAEEGLEALLARKRFTSVDFTSYCCTSFGGFELVDDSSYPIPGSQLGGLWVGFNGSRRRLLCGHMVNVLDDALTQYEMKRVRYFSELPVMRRDLIRAHLGAFRQVRHYPPAAGKAPTTGLCFTVRSVVHNVVADMEYVGGLPDVSIVLKDVSKHLLVQALLTPNPLSGARRTMATRMLDWMEHTSHGHMCKFIGVVAFLRHNNWFPSATFDNGGGDVSIPELTDYPIPGGRHAYTNESLDNWVGDQLTMRLALAESCIDVLRDYIKGEC
ncbi:hypothetical protein Ahp1_04 [Aeromonas phage Ahp1]|uniref:Uncharacterized protein n=1 Tax=Aeromonas phage Ahp1 TaxID=1747286 RepID=A0A1S5Q895_9CAUD|nr:hypothetical protein HOS19_gp04 [Aeromonas phage Ahp1]ALP47723.1 hypothetical protein Ahp1_04 [Aeromonas phage Ahp1]